jgi:hypothetical protein
MLNVLFPKKKGKYLKMIDRIYFITSSKPISTRLETAASQSGSDVGPKNKNSLNFYFEKNFFTIRINICPMPSCFFK